MDALTVARRGAYTRPMPESTRAPTDAFAPTRWSLVVAAADSDPSAARPALVVLCETYWYPLYAFARRRGRSPADAEDLVQGFLARFVEKRDLGGADPARGRFRAFLLGAFRHHAQNVDRDAKAAKRGGGQPVLSLDAADAERRFALEPSHDETPEKAYERAWAHEVLARAMARLEARQVEKGRGEQFAALRACLGGSPPATAELAAATGLSEGAVRVAVHRLRKSYGQALRDEIADTLDDPAAVDAELAALREALAS